ncbi:unnamed protein product [Rotaria magnacalcarata]|uniref:Uncharacterized protein n=1 Tax=Rotaria magnacalcarata TaxID=392030 RepID=A0A8S3G7K1_9BILA|nr:unnamed protein product [Rotaria magnacalcarata]
MNRLDEKKTLSLSNSATSPASHGCCTPTKKPKRPPNYAGYHEEHSDEEIRQIAIHHHTLTPPPPPPVPTDPLRVRLFPNDSDDDTNNNLIYSRKSPIKLKFDSSGAED